MSSGKLATPEEIKMLGPVKIQWQELEEPGDDRWFNLFIGNEDIATWGGTIVDNAEDFETSYSFLQVAGNYRRHGLATQLVEALAHTAVAHNAAKIAGSVESQHTLRIFNKLFGEDSLTFSSTMDADEPYMGDLPMSVDQSISTLERAERFEDRPDFREHGLYVVIDLSKTSRDFNPPVEIA